MQLIPNCRFTSESTPPELQGGTVGYCRGLGRACSRSAKPIANMPPAVLGPQGACHLMPLVGASPASVVAQGIDQIQRTGSASGAAQLQIAGEVVEDVEGAQGPGQAGFVGDVQVLRQALAH